MKSIKKLLSKCLFYRIYLHDFLHFTLVSCKWFHTNSISQKNIRIKLSLIFLLVNNIKKGFLEYQLLFTT